NSRSSILIAIWSAVAVVWFVIMAILASTGWAEIKVAKGSVWRLIWVSAVLALIVDLPVMVFAGYVSSGTALAEQVGLTLVPLIFSIQFTSMYLQPPVRMTGSKQ